MARGSGEKQSSNECYCQDLRDDKSTVVQVMGFGAVRQQAITWANVDSDLSTYSVTRPQWVKLLHETYFKLTDDLQLIFVM